MNTFFQGALVVGFMVAANVVAAGVWLVLGGILQKMAPGIEAPWPWILIGAAAAIAAFLFLRGAMCYANRVPLIQWRHASGEARSTHGAD